MIPFAKCPICGNDLTEREVEKMLNGGKNMAVIRVKAEVCLKCGERLYSEDMIKLFEEIRDKLKNEETKDFEIIGQAYRVSLTD